MNLIYFHSFDISQKDALNLIIAIQKLLSFTVTVTNLGDNNYKLKVSSVRYIENVIKFLHHNPVKLLGYKRLQYILWLKKLRTIPKYSKKIDIPQNY
jgi:ubiquinol-cytochrome c reductase cytochrome b subunit